MAVAIGLDGDCDVAAMTYGPDDRPDDLMAAFAADLAGQGVDVVGVAQRRPGPDLVRLPDGARIDRIPAALAEAQAWLTQVVDRDPDLVIINRFGVHECAGSGLVPVIAAAIRRDVPVLLAVPEALFPDWLVASGGLSVRLACRRARLDGWWRSLGHRGTVREGFCTRFK